jgi:hypothetical protein
MKKITQKELSDYLRVTPQAVNEYKKTPLGKRKLDLMLKGLQFLQLDPTIRIMSKRD